PSAAGADARRRPAGDVAVHRRGTATTQMRPRRRNPKGAWVLRASLQLLVVDDVHRHRLPPRALRSPHFHSPIWKFARSGTLRVNTHARDPLYFHHGLLCRDGRQIACVGAVQEGIRCAAILKRWSATSTDSSTWTDSSQFSTIS